MNEIKSMDSYARWYVDNLFPAIIPVGAWTYNNSVGEIVDLWKHPLIKRWQADPLATRGQVTYEWQRFQYYGNDPNIGLVTGQICGGYIVIDIDRNHREGVDGYETLLSWQQETGITIPETWTVITGTGGYHLYFKTDKWLRGSVNEDLGVDIRADGNMVVLPPSLHRNGNRYEWEISPLDCKCAELTPDVMQFIKYVRPSDYEYSRPNSGNTTNNESVKMLLPSEIMEGGRHTPLVSLIRTLDKLGVSDEAIEQLVRFENNKKCNPPLTETELQKEIFPAIGRYGKGVNESEWKSKEQYASEMKQISRKQMARKFLR